MISSFFHVYLLMSTIFVSLIHADETTESRSLNMSSGQSRQVHISLTGQSDDDLQAGNDQNGQGYDLASLEQEIQKLLKFCMTFMPMMENYIASQTGIPEFASGGVDIVVIQFHIDNCFLTCESVLNARAAYNLGARSVNGNNMSQQN